MGDKTAQGKQKSWEWDSNTANTKQTEKRKVEEKARKKNKNSEGSEERNQDPKPRDWVFYQITQATGFPDVKKILKVI